MTVYIDIVFMANVVSSLLLLFSVNLIFSIKGKWYRILISSLVCGIYGVLEAVYILWQPFRIVTLLFMIQIAWGYKGSLYNFLRVAFLEGITVIVIIGISRIFGINSLILQSGITLVAKDYITAIITVTTYPLIIIISYLKKSYKRLIKITFFIDGVELRFRLLYDSGNLLCHKGIPVAVIDWRNFPSINSYEEMLLTAPERLVYNTVSSSGIMPLIKPERVVLEGVYRECYIGLTNKRFVGYQGVIGDIK